MTAKTPHTLGKPLFELDKKALKLFKPFAKTTPGKAIDGVGKLTDQPELRVLCASLLTLGVLRADGPMIRAGTRMLVAHETANFVKKMIKRRIDRRRPRSEHDGHPAKPRKGRDTAKEMTSFPSGHSAGGMAVACAYASVYPERAVPAVATAAAFSASRVVVAAHYPSDVVAGSVLGAATNGALALVLRGLRTVALAAVR